MSINVIGKIKDFWVPVTQEKSQSEFCEISKSEV